MASVSTALRHLAEACGVEPTYAAAGGEQREATPEALIAVLRALGVPLDGPDDAASALREREQSRWRRPLEPVLLAWDGQPAPAELRRPVQGSGQVLGCRLELESGEARAWSCRWEELPPVSGATVEGVAYEVRRLVLPGPLPLGYHRLVVEQGDAAWSAVVLSAPVRAYPPPGQDEPPTWGGFLPLYAVRSARDWGAGDLADLDALQEWVCRHGGKVVGTLPLMAAFLDEPFEPSPYSPVSRLFWNEFYLDVDAVPELADNPAARALLASPAFQARRDALRADPLVDYRSVMGLKREVLGALVRDLFAGSSPRRQALERFAAEHPRVEDYARFRAASERQRTFWPDWPGRQRDGDLRPGDYDEDARRYHLYVQWLADEQLRRLAARAGERGAGLYLDFPVGVHAAGYDVWRERDSFAVGMSAGAPPDAVFTRGQDWGFPPLHPDHLRARGYQYLRACLHHSLQFAGALRIDHAMGLHRFYWVPKDLGPQQGAYVRYPAEELYAVYSLESHRAQAVLVGEDLGTVPPEVPPAMARHHVHRMYVIQYELQAEDAALPPMPAGSMASLNTHDMPPFSAYWEGTDITDRCALGLLTEADCATEEKKRQAIRASLVRHLRQAGVLAAGEEDVPALVRACLHYLARGPAWVVLANLEDLWQETEPQNTPGTTDERPNWRHKARVALEEFDRIPGLAETLAGLGRTIRERAEEKNAGRACQGAQTV